MAGRFSVEAVFKAVDRMTAPVSRMQNRVGKFTRSMDAQFGRLNRSVDTFASGVKKGALAVTAALALSTGAMANVVSTGADFEQTLVSAAVKFPGEIRKGTAAFAELERAARTTGATTEFSASEAAQALNFLAMAGFDAESSVAALPGVVDLATAAQVDLATATDIASDTLGAFGLATKDATQLGINLARVNDVIAKTTTTSNTTVEKLFETMRKAGPVATSAGSSLETVAAMAGVMANAGIKAELAGTAIANSFLNLSNPASRATKVMQRLGIQTRNSAGELLDMPDIIDNIQKATADLSKTQRLAVIESIFGREGLAGTANVIASGGQALREYRKQLEGATGASSTMASVMRDTLQGRLNSLKSAVEGVKISIFSMTEGPLADVIDRTTEWVRANEKLIATNVGEFLARILNNLPKIIEYVGWGLKAIAAFMAFAAVLKTLIAILTLVNLVMAANPITLIVLGVIAAIAAFAALVTWIDDVAAAFDDMNPFLRAILAPLELIVRTIKFIKDAFTGGFGEAVGKLLTSIGFGDEEMQAAKTADSAPQMVSPQDRVARSIEEQRTTSTAEVTIRDETGRAEVTGGKLGPGLALANSGAF